VIAPASHPPPLLNYPITGEDICLLHIKCAAGLAKVVMAGT
jgi:hypothetical protein